MAWKVFRNNQQTPIKILGSAPNETHIPITNLINQSETDYADAIVSMIQNSEDYILKLLQVESGHNTIYDTHIFADTAELTVGLINELSM